VASCGYVLIAEKVLGADPNARARLLEGIITAVGFIGGGAILKHGASVSGTATAASIWNTGAVGISVAYGRYEIAVLLVLLNFASLRLLLPFKDSADRQPPPPSAHPESKEPLHPAT
jgi:putative Mg2+ transporter-C (MgtC) family protein